MIHSPAIARPREVAARVSTNEISLSPQSEGTPPDTDRRGFLRQGAKVAGIVGLGLLGESLRKSYLEYSLLSKFVPQFTMHVYGERYMNSARFTDAEHSNIRALPTDDEEIKCQGMLELFLAGPVLPGEYSIYRGYNAEVRNIDLMDRSKVSMPPLTKDENGFVFDFSTDKLPTGRATKEVTLPPYRSPEELLRLAMHCLHDTNSSNRWLASSPGRWSNESLQYPELYEFQIPGENVRYKIYGLESLAGMTPEFFNDYFRSYLEIKEPKVFKLMRGNPPGRAS